MGDVAHTSFSVALEAKHNLRSTVPSRGNVLCHVSCVLIRVDGEASSETKVANLELAIGIDKQVAGLEISVEDIGRVDVLETT